MEFWLIKCDDLEGNQDMWNLGSKKVITREEYGTPRNTEFRLEKVTIREEIIEEHGILPPKK